MDTERLNFMYLLVRSTDNPFQPPFPTRQVYISRELAEAEVKKLNRDVDYGLYSVHELIVQDNLG